MTQTEVEFDAIRPAVSREEALERVDTDAGFTADDVDAVAAPKFLFDYEIRLERLFLSDRLVAFSTTVDGMTGYCFRTDVYPELTTQTLPEDAILESRVDRDEAAEKSRATVRRYINFQFATFIIVGKTPDIEIIRENFAYALYWLVPHGWYESFTPNVTIIDSTTGHRLKQKVPKADIDPKTFVL
ncbi:MAG: hypothetical protein ABEI96_06730 [Haloarculaceae archaeon]